MASRLGDGRSVGVINVMGRVFMANNDDPFRLADELLKQISAKVILVDFHAEATSEKIYAVERVDLQFSLGVAAVCAWLFGWLHLSFGQYLLGFVYPGAALSLLRSFAEHRAAPEPGRRIAIVERAPLFGLLFFNNNLHAVHHAFPGASWRRLP